MLLEYIRNVLIYTVCVPPRNLTHEFDEIPKSSGFFWLKLKQFRATHMNYEKSTSCVIVEFMLIQLKV